MRRGYGMRTYDVARSLICALPKACFWRQQTRVITPNTATERFAIPDANSQYVFSGAVGGSVDEAVLWCATNTH